MRRSLVAIVVGLLAAAPALSQAPSGAPRTGPTPGTLGPTQYPPAYPPSGEPMPVYQPTYPYHHAPQGGPPSAVKGCPPVLSGKDPNAWDDRCLTGSGEGVFISLGGIFLERERLGNGVIVQRDPIGLGGPVVMTFNDLDPTYSGGLRYCLGYRFDTNAVELCGYYLFDNIARSEVTQVGELNLPFAAFPAPVGFEGSVGLWQQADRVRQSLLSRMFNTELNFRRGNGVGGELITGLRYLNLAEIYSVFTDDDSVALGVVSPLGQATYSVRSQNHILAPQVGLEIERLINQCVAFGFFGKAAFGVNFNEVTGRLERGDGLTAPLSTRSRAQFTHLYEGGVFFDYLPFERVRFRAGYQLLYIANVPEAHANVNFNLTSSLIGDNPSGDIFYHGPMFELSLAF